MDDDVDITIDVHSVIPLSEQIRAGIAHLIRSGRLVEETRLPTVRSLAADLGVAVNTVNKAYAELDREGLIVSRRRAGTRVRRREALPPPAPVVLNAIGLLVEASRAESVDEETVVALLRAALARQDLG